MLLLQVSRLLHLAEQLCLPQLTLTQDPQCGQERADGTATGPALVRLDVVCYVINKAFDCYPRCTQQ